MNKIKEQGFTLLEVLISVFVLALGVIGAAGMQLTALRTTQQSSFHTMALELASEMADKMRANDSQMKLDDNRNPFLQVDYRSAVDGEPTVPATLCYSADCSGSELAAFDIYEWQKRVKATLPNGRVLICRDSAPWDNAAGALTWACNSSSSGTSASSVVIKLGWQGKNPDGSLIKDGNNPPRPSITLTVEPYIK